jgi:quercetin dioxygenase-like cupin family protein
MSNPMTQDEFRAEMTRAGFENPVVVERDPNGALDEHVHPFEARALILSGEITLTVNGQDRVYRSGDVFHLQQNEPHIEKYGPAGVRYLSARK